MFGDPRQCEIEKKQNNDSKIERIKLASEKWGVRETVLPSIWLFSADFGASASVFILFIRVGRDRGSLLDLGHHVNSFIFGHDQTTLSLQKKKKFTLDRGFFPLNQWNDLTIEIKEGAIIIQVNDRKEIFKDDLITLQNDVEVQQVDFKGQDFGTVQIDWLKLYRGIE